MKNCPFCNSDNNSDGSMFEYYFYIACDECGSQGPLCESIDEARNKWNGSIKMDEEFGGVSAPMSTPVNTPGMGNATPASSAGMTGSQQTSSDVIGSGDNWGAVKKKKKKRKKVEEDNINPYDKIGTQMAKDMDVPMTFKKGKNGTVKQKKVSNESYKIKTLDEYMDSMLEITAKEDSVKYVKGKNLLKDLGIPFNYTSINGEHIPFIMMDIDDMKQKLENSGWERGEEYRERKGDALKYTKGNEVLTIFDGEFNKPYVTLT